MYDAILETANFLKKQYPHPLSLGLILGSGLGTFAEEISQQHVISYKDIPNFPESTVKGHQGKLIFGTVAGKHVVAMQGRFHYYEGYDMATVTFPVRVMKYMGLNHLLVSNASGGVNPTYEVGGLVAITDHINMFPEHPLRGANDERLGPRFVNMSEPYSKSMTSTLMQIAQQQAIKLQTGIYLGLQGPTFETLAEYKMVSRLGADCVGMSTVPEVIVARHMGMHCLGLSVITDLGFEDAIDTVDHQEVLMAAKKAEPQVKQLIKTFIEVYDFS